jgi:hypothetical protein
MTCMLISAMPSIGSDETQEASHSVNHKGQKKSTVCQVMGRLTRAFFFHVIDDETS